MQNSTLQEWTTVENLVQMTVIEGFYYSDYYYSIPERLRNNHFITIIEVTDIILFPELDPSVGN